MKVTELKKDLVACIHFLHQKGFAPATSSNYSVREAGATEFYISASGIDKGAFSVKDLMKVDQFGIPVKDSRKPSAETQIHTMIYDHKPEVNCVLHTHTICNTVLSHVLKSQGHIRLEGFEVLKGLEGISTHESVVDLPIFENAQNIPELSQKILQFWKNNEGMQGFLLAGHGLYAWGKDIPSAKRHIEVFEFLLECYYNIQLLTRKPFHAFMSTDTIKTS